MKNILKTTITGTLIIATGFYFAFQTGTQETQAQQAPTNIRVTCAPDKEFVLRNSPVKFTATVQNATSTIVYSWRGANITSRNAPDVTVQYGSLGVKRATTTINTGGVTLSAGCSVTVVTTLPGGNNNSGSNSNQGGNQGGNNNQGGLPGGGQGLPGGQQGGSNFSNSGNNSSGNQGGQNQGSQQTGGNSISSLSQEGNNQSGGNNQQSGGNSQNRMQQQINQCQQSGSSGGSGSQNSADQVKEMIQNSQAQASQGMQQQMVPVNPIPIVDPILNIQENIKLLTAKEIGTADGTSDVALDQKEACTVDVMLQNALEKTTNFIYKADNGDPVWITNYPKHFAEQRANTVEMWLKQLQNKQSCGTQDQEHRNIAKDLLRLEQNNDIFKENPELCQLEKKDKYDVSKLENFLALATPNNNPTFKRLNAAAQLDRTTGAQAALNAYEINVNDGIKSILDEEKQIKLPSNVYLPQTLEYLTIAVKRYIELDEAGEEEAAAALREFMLKVIQTPDTNSSTPNSNLQPLT